LSRPTTSTWSRRRAGVRAEAEAELVEAAVDEKVRVEAELADKSDAEILQELSLQDPDEMQSGDDFSAFMRKEVPERLRKRALRTLWRSNPVLACVDELVDYGDDFKAEWNASGVIKTAYQVGKGMLAHVQEMERQKAAEEQAEAMAASAPEQDAETLTAFQDEADDGSAIAAEEDAPNPDFVPDLVPEQGQEADQPAIIHRMRFEFDEVSS